MTRLSVWTVRTALLYLGAGFFLGALMLTQKGLPFDPALLRLLPLHIEFVLLGWTLQLARLRAAERGRSVCRLRAAARRRSLCGFAGTPG